MHYAFVKELLDLPGVDYFPFTLYELAQPNKYNIQYLERQGTDLKSFYKMEANWGYSSKKVRPHGHCLTNQTSVKRKHNLCLS